MTIRWISAAALLTVAGCALDTDVTRNTPGLTEVASLVPQPVQDSATGRCWAVEITPAAYEQVMGEVQVVQAVLDDDGTVITPPVYRRAPVPRLVRPRNELRFEAPCPADMPEDFAASVQRALAARGYFAGNVTGLLDAPTTAAIRLYQLKRGLDSGQLSLQTARELGLIAVPRTPS